MVSTVYYSSNRITPNQVGFVPFGLGKILRLCNDVLFVYSLYLQGGVIKSKNVIKRSVQFYHNQGRYDGTTIKLIEWLSQPAAVGEVLHVLPPIYSTFDESSVTTEDFQIRADILESVGPEGFDRKAVYGLSPGGTVEQILVTDTNILVSFTNPNNVVELPLEADLYNHIVKPGYGIEEGVPIADLIPRKEYSWVEFQMLPVATKQRVIQEFVDSMAWNVDTRGRRSKKGKKILPINMLKEAPGAGQLFEYGGPRKPLQLKELKWKDAWFEVDLSEDSFGW